MDETIHVVIETGSRHDTNIFVPDGGLVFGRGSECDVKLDDPKLSRRHCRLHFITGRLYVTDLQSSNGTLVNDVPATTRPLSSNDIILIGDTALRVVNPIDPSYGDFRPAREARDEKPPSLVRRGIGTAFRIVAAVCWIALIAWWLFLAYSLMLPPPPKDAVTEEAPATGLGSLPVTVPDSEADADRAPSPDSSSTPAPSAASAPGAAVRPPIPGLAAYEDQPLAELFRTVSANLLAEDFAPALQEIQARRTREGSEAYLRALEDLANYVTDVSTINERITSVFVENLGEPIALRRDNKVVTIIPEVIAGGRIQAKVRRESGAMAKMDFTVEQLSPADRARLLGTPDTPQEHAMLCILLYRAKDRAGALSHAAEAGMLGDALREAIMATP